MAPTPTTRPTRKKNQKRRPHQRLSIQKTIMHTVKPLNHFSCATCKNLLNKPVTVKCGHTTCLKCLDISNGQCGVCGDEVERDTAAINILLQSLIEKWKERNRVENIDIPTVILLLHPRYSLRSGYAGLHYTIDIKNAKKQLRSQTLQVEFPRKQLYDRISRRQRNVLKIPFQKMLDSVVKELASSLDKALRFSWSFITMDDLECLLCRQVLTDPVTTPCGHTFCRDCLTRVIDHRLRCPLCVAKLTPDDYCRGTTTVLDQAVRFFFPVPIPKSHDDFREFFQGERINVPVFVCTNAFPGVACPLHVYEPRYRLLIRRCLKSPSKMFAMISVDSGGQKFTQYGTILEVQDAVTLVDGRMMLTTLGVSRFRVLSRSENDGYDTAVIEQIRDTTPAVQDISTIRALHVEVHSRAVKWVGSLPQSALAEVERFLGKMPGVEDDWMALPDGPKWTWWLIPILPLNSQLRVGFLSSTSLEKRLRAIDKTFEHMDIRLKEKLGREESVSYAEHNDGSFCSE